MENIVVTNGNVILESNPSDCKELEAGPRGMEEPSGAAAEEAWQGQVEIFRRLISNMACSSTWAEDCLYRGTRYAPDFRCSCALCRAQFPDRLYPRPSRQSRISADCQVETAEDPEFAEELARLRNDRQRVGSVFIAASSRDCGGGSSGRSYLRH